MKAFVVSHLSVGGAGNVQHPESVVLAENQENAEKRLKDEGFSPAKRPFFKKRKKKRKKKKIMVEVRTTKWKLAELIEHRGKFIIVKLPTGELIRHHPHKKVRWGKTKRITKGMMSFGSATKT